MNIYVVSSQGEASRLISAFDKALQNAGVSNYNLIILSSVIPPGSQIKEVKKYSTPPEEYGHKLYCVRAEKRSEKKGEVIGAGLGYYQLPDGRGVFVEHERKGSSIQKLKKQLKEDILNSISDLCRARHFPVKKGDIKQKICVMKVGNKPACALVIAVYQSEGWK